MVINIQISENEASHHNTRMIDGGAGGRNATGEYLSAHFACGD